MPEIFRLIAVTACAAMLAIAPQSADAHGRLTAPEPRDVVGTGLAAYESNNPVSGYLGQDFVCRNFDNAGPSKATLVAGATSTFTTGMTAAHVGDCSLYLSYDSSKWFKIANVFDCKANNYNPTSFSVPDWLPAGNAVMRWEWVALHVWPNIEFYTQCVDVTITRTSGTGQMPNANDMFAIPGHLPAPGSNYRNPWGSGDTHIEGPAVASRPSTAPLPATTTSSSSTTTTLSSTTTTSSSACVPITCQDKFYSCGSHFDGCGNKLVCGSCPASSVCTGGACVPKSCKMAGDEMSESSDVVALSESQTSTGCALFNSVSSMGALVGVTILFASI